MGSSNPGGFRTAFGAAAALQAKFTFGLRPRPSGALPASAPVRASSALEWSAPWAGASRREDASWLPRSRPRIGPSPVPPFPNHAAKVLWIRRPWQALRGDAGGVMLGQVKRSNRAMARPPRARPRLSHLYLPAGTAPAAKPTAGANKSGPAIRSPSAASRRFDRREVLRSTGDIIGPARGLRVGGEDRRSCEQQCDRKAARDFAHQVSAPLVVPNGGIVPGLLFWSTAENRGCAWVSVRSPMPRRALWWLAKSDDAFAI